MIYFIQNPVNGLVKIGTSSDPMKRVHDIECSIGSELKILCMAPGDRFIERGLHAMYSEHRVHGEWFDLPKGVDFIKAVNKVNKTSLSDYPSQSVVTDSRLRIKQDGLLLLKDVSATAFKLALYYLSVMPKDNIVCSARAEWNKFSEFVGNGGYANVTFRKAVSELASVGFLIKWGTKEYTVNVDFFALGASNPKNILKNYKSEHFHG